jgi:hypothetical protein
MARTWLSIRVDLIEGRGDRCWPRPGWIFAASRRHAFAELADAIDTAFSRWDRSHLTLFELSDGSRVYGPIEWDEPLNAASTAPDTPESAQHGRAADLHV